MKDLHLVCSRCNRVVPVTELSPTCSCGGLWNLQYDLLPFSLDEIDTDQWNIFRYSKFIALEDDAFQKITLGEGMTPVIQLDKDVLLKMDYFMPTLSFKDRGAAVVVSHCKSIGVKKVVQDSSGNAGNSIAAYCARAEIDCEIFVPEAASPKKIDLIRSHGATCTVVPGSRDHCADVCREKVKNEHIFYANHVFNPFFYEGTKTYIYEVYEQLHRIPSFLFIPVGNGTLLLGSILALEHLLSSKLISKFPKIIAVQSEYCDPLYRCAVAHTDKPELINPKPTLAEGIAIGAPMRGTQILRYASKYDIRFALAPENRILKARSILAHNGIYCEHTTAATYAAYLQFKQDNPDVTDCLLPMCGAGLKSDH